MGKRVDIYSSRDIRLLLIFALITRGARSVRTNTTANMYLLAV